MTFLDWVTLAGLLISIHLIAVGTIGLPTHKFAFVNIGVMLLVWFVVHSHWFGCGTW